MASLVLKHSSYYGVFSLSGRKQHWIKIGKVDKVNARKILKQLELEFIKDRLSLTQHRPISLSDFINKYLDYTKATKAKQTYRAECFFCRNFLNFTGNVLLSKLDTQTIERYRASLVNAGRQPTGINREIAMLDQMLNKAIDWKYIDTNPFKGVKRMKQPRTPAKMLTLEEIQALLNTANAWLKPMLVLLLNTGVRVGELLSLQWKDIDFDRQCITVIASKTNNFRAIPMTGECRQMLLWLRENYVLPKSLTVSPRQAHQMQYVFCLPDGSKIDRIKHAFSKLCRKAGIKAHPHMLRHSFASHLVMQGVDLVSVKELLGHTQIATTMIYSHLSHQHKANAIALLPWTQTGLTVFDK